MALPLCARNGPTLPRNINYYLAPNCGVRRLAVRIATAAGYRVLAAGDGENALTLARSIVGPIHLLLTDVMMAGMNGAQLAHEMLEMRPGLPVLYMSGHPLDDGIGGSSANGPVIESSRKLVLSPLTEKVSPSIRSTWLPPSL